MPLEQWLALGMIIVGVLMLLAEMAVPGNFLIVPATVLLILGFIGIIAPAVLISWYSPLIAVVILIPTALLTVRFYQRMSPPAPPETTVATSLIGKTGVVTTDVRPNTLRGKVQIDHDDWSATADKCIVKGARVRVVSSEGVHVHVEEVMVEGRPSGQETPECQ